MFLVKDLIYFLSLQLVIASPQINLHLTDWANDNIHDAAQQHDCFYPDLTETKGSPQIIPYCMSIWLPKWPIVSMGSPSIFTFDELGRRNVTSKQLHRWSAPIDTIENYQLYLDLLSSGHAPSLEMKTLLFYNCSSLTFGPVCQYALDVRNRDLSLNEMIRYHYLWLSDQAKPSNCYTHLKCNRGLTSMCLDWSEICDGKIDCTDGADEKDCWQLTSNQCNDGEYRCDNGQCIPYAFVDDRSKNFECLDRSDEYGTAPLISQYQSRAPTFQSEDVVCPWRKNRVYASPELRPFTSSCDTQRHLNIEQAILSDVSNTTISNDCFLAVQCHLKISVENDSICSDLCKNESCPGIIGDVCPEMFYYPTVPIAYGHIYFAYTNQHITNSTGMESIPPTYICYNEQLCDGLDSNTSFLSFRGNICRRPEDLSASINHIRGSWYPNYIRLVYSQFGHCNSLVDDHNSIICKHSTMYQCKNSSKCIPKSFVGDGIRDCVYNDDEEQITIDELCWADSTDVLYRCETDNKCIHRNQVQDGLCNCETDGHSICSDEDPKQNKNKEKITFSTICDSFVDLSPITINGQTHTDETECQHWPCNNTYTRCDGLWQCLDGSDEVGCDPSLAKLCPPDHHVCLSPMRFQLVCLPLVKANDGVVDCYGGLDEPSLCPISDRLDEKKFYCGTCISSLHVCDGIVDCVNGDDERLCNLTTSRAAHTSLQKSKSSLKRSQFSTIDESEHYCSRGFPVQVQVDNDRNLSATVCFCPPSYYGDRCQYQNQRVSLTMQVNAPSNSQRTVFVLVISLIDDSAERVVHSYEQLSYFHMRDQHTKFNMYLLYSARPKDSTRNYAVHIDIYEMTTLHYHGSLLMPLKFPFLPVERLAVELNIPQASDIQNCTNRQCIHGECMLYLNDPTATGFCRCEPGWTGKYCSIPQMCTCSLDSLCAGVAANNRSICVCPLNKFGPRCLLTSIVCQGTPCRNGGLCLPSNEYSASPEPYMCVCRKGFSGKKCETPDTKFTLMFDSKIVLSSQLPVFFHYIHLVNHTTFTQDTRPSVACENPISVTNYGSSEYHVALVEPWTREYYLIASRKVASESSSVTRVINPSDRCQYISELFNSSIVDMHLLRRVKYYHLPCRDRTLNISCFFDDVHMCLCEDAGSARVANCFEFNYQTELDFDYNKIEAECSTDHSSRAPATHNGVSPVPACDHFAYSLHTISLIFLLSLIF